MNVNDTRIPENLMLNVENRLRNHVQRKKKKKNLYAASIALVLALGVPASALAYNSYIKSIPYSQEVDLARQNNMTTKLNTSFKYKDVEFKFKEIVADETGMVVLYDVSDPKYTIGKITMADAEGKALPEWGLLIPNNDEKNKEKAFYSAVKGDSLTYMKNNLITIKINQLNSLSSSKSIDVDWSIKVQVPIQPIKTISINKEFKLDIGTIKFNSLKIGTLKTLVSYDFEPVESSMMFSPIFSFRIGNEYLDSVNDYTDGANFDNNSIELKSVYYSNPKEIGIRLLGGYVYYNNNNNKEYLIDKDKLPMEFKFDGENIRVTSMKEDKDYIKYTFELDKYNRRYSYLLPELIGKSLDASVIDDEKVQFIDQAKRDKLYNALVSKVPNFEKIYEGAQLQKAATKLEVKVPKDAAQKFNITTASKSFLVDLDEIVVKP